LTTLLTFASLLTSAPLWNSTLSVAAIAIVVRPSRLSSKHRFTSA